MSGFLPFLDSLTPRLARLEDCGKRKRFAQAKWCDGMKLSKSAWSVAPPLRLAFIFHRASSHRPAAFFYELLSCADNLRRMARVHAANSSAVPPPSANPSMDRYRKVHKAEKCWCRPVAGELHSWATLLETQRNGH